MPTYDFFCPSCGATLETVQRMATYTRPQCLNGCGEMQADFSKRGDSHLEGYLQEKGKWPWYDIQTDTTYQSRAEWKADMKRRGLRSFEKDEMSDRNRELFRHRKVY